MAIDVYIYSSQHLQEARGDLEDDLDDFLSGAGEVTGGGLGEVGWNIDLRLEDSADVEDLAHRLVLFLRDRGVPEDTFFEVCTDRTEPRRVEVFASY